MLAVFYAVGVYPLSECSVNTGSQVEAALSVTKPQTGLYMYSQCGPPTGSCRHRL